MYGASVWKLRVDDKRRLGATFNRAIRCLFGYNDFESVNDLTFCLSTCLLIELNCCYAVHACRARELFYYRKKEQAIMVN